jgi:hypothetical protein
MSYTKENTFTKEKNYTKNNYTKDDAQINKPVIRKPGRTILIKTHNEITDKFTGLTNSIYQNTNGTQFLIFDTVENATSAFDALKQNTNIKVKYAHYRIFFTITGLDNTIDYTTLKNEHIQWLKSNSDADVLYYKQYRKGDNFIGCGDFTIDTKESMDKLLNKDELKQYSFNKYSGTYYRYNKKQEPNKEN